MQPSQTLLSTAYFPPVQYVTKFILYSYVYIEQYEHYSKQSYRNRCTILSANGPLDLSIPVERSSEIKILTKDICIDNTKRWKVMHWRAIESAYRSSPFFLYYADDIYNAFFETQIHLLDFNSKLLKQILDLLHIKVSINTTESFKNNETEFFDLSDAIHPKIRMQKPDNEFIVQNYYQVFEPKFGFVPNLSILDLLFNMGPASYEILKSCISINVSSD